MGRGRGARGGDGGNSARSTAVLPLGARAGRVGVEYCGVGLRSELLVLYSRMCGGRRPVVGRSGRVLPLSMDDVDRLVFAGAVHDHDHRGRGSHHDATSPTRTRPSLFAHTPHRRSRSVRHC